MDGGPIPDRLAAIATTCPYCGVGCGVIAKPDGWGGAAIAGDEAHPANFGKLCSKGTALGETLSLEGRLLRPEIRGVPVSWEAALSEVGDGFARTIAAHGPDSVALYVSGQLLTEDYYVANKLAKGFFGTANIDTNSRLCMASSVACHRRAFGADVVPGNYEDLEQADLVVLVGSNLAWCHPILFRRLEAARRQRNLRVVTIDPRRTATAEETDLHLALRPGTDVALFNGLLAYLAREEVCDRKFVEAHTDGVDKAVAAAMNEATADIAAVARICGLSEEKTERFFRWFAEREKTVTVYSQGVNQSSSGVDKVNAIVNCHLFTGRIGRTGMGPFSATGQPNAMGGREVGALANQLAAHMDFAPDDIDRVKRFWRSPRVAGKPGLKAVDLFRAIEEGRVKAVWIMATNPAVSLPDSDQVRRALAKCPLVVVADCMRDTDTAQFAHVLLPAAAWGEKEGSVTNSERRVSRQRAFLPPPGDARPDWWIMSAVARRMGFGEAFAFNSAADIFREHAALSAFENDGVRAFDLGALATISDIDYEALSPVQWPLRRQEKPKARLYGDGRFHHPDGRARFIAVAPRKPSAEPDEHYGLRLNTGRVRDQWHTMTRTGKSPRLAQHSPEPTIDIHPRDADRAGVTEGQFARVESRFGAAAARIRLSDAQREGDLFVAMHWSDQFASTGRINAVVNPAVDPVSGQPELKHTPVCVTPLSPRWFAFVLSRDRLMLGHDTYWSATRGVGHWRYEIAGEQAAPAALIAQVEPPGGCEQLAFDDSGAAVMRRAWLRGGRLEACVFIGSKPILPAREWLAGLFSADALSPQDRAWLLAARSPAAQQALGPIVCACHGVSRDVICGAIAGGARSTQAVGAAVKAGTNCGSCLPEIARLLKEVPVPAK